MTGRVVGGRVAISTAIPLAPEWVIAVTIPPSTLGRSNTEILIVSGLWVSYLDLYAVAIKHRRFVSITHRISTETGAP